MLDLISGGLAIFSGISSLFGSEEDSARESEAAQKRAAFATANANINVLSTEYKSTIAALNSSYQSSVTAFNMKTEAFQTDREANALLADGVIEQARIDKQQINLQRDDTLRQIDENVRAAKLEREYSFDAAKKSRTIAKEDARDVKRAGSALIASSRTIQAASGFDIQGSPALVDEVLMADLEQAISKTLHKGDVEFWDEMRTVQEVNRYIVNQGVDKAATKKATEFNLENIEARTGLELRAVAIQRRQTELQEKEALLIKQQAEDDRDLAKYTAKQSFEAKKGVQSAGATATGYTATANANATVAAAQDAGMRSLVGGISSGLDTIRTGSSFKSLAAKGGVFG